MLSQTLPREATTTAIMSATGPLPSSPRRRVTGVVKGDNNDEEGREAKDSASEDASSSSSSSTTTSNDNNDDDDSQLQDAVASSSALVGENVLDSPQGHQRPSVRSGGSSNRSFQTRSGTTGGGGGAAAALSSSSIPYPSPPPSLGLTTTTPQHHHHHRSRTRSSSETSATRNQPSQRRTVARRSTESSAADGDLSVGIVAQGFAWVQRQRDRRRRLYLQHQAEQQLQRLKEATKADAILAAQRHQQQQQQQLQQQQRPPESAAAVIPSLTDSPTFQSFARVLQGNLEAFARQQGTRDAGNGSDDDNDDDDLYSGPFPSLPSLSCAGGGSLGFPEISPSGDGYSVSLPVLAGSTSHSHSHDECGDYEEDDVEGSEDSDAFVPPVRVEDEDGPHLEQCPLILSERERQQVAELVLPRGIAYCKWRRLYSLARDGDSFDQCLRCVEGEQRTLLVVRTSRNQVCGGFADRPWCQPGGVGSSAGYFGGPDSCLFKVEPDVDGGGDGRIRPFRWTGANRYVLLCDPSHTMLAFGGGGDDSAFGLSVEQDFQVGSTGHCETFDNEPLCDQETFKIVDMEIYGFLIGQF